MTGAPGYVMDRPSRVEIAFCLLLVVISKPTAVLAAIIPPWPNPCGRREDVI